MTRLSASQTSEIAAAVFAGCAAIGGFLAYAHAEMKAEAAQQVAVHSAQSMHKGAAEEMGRLRDAQQHNAERIGRLESESRVMSEILVRIESKIDVLTPRRGSPPQRVRR